MCPCFLIFSFETKKVKYNLINKKPVRPLKFKFKFNQNCQAVHNIPQYEGVLWT